MWRPHAYSSTRDTGSGLFPDRPVSRPQGTQTRRLHRSYRRAPCATLPSQQEFTTTATGAAEPRQQGIQQQRRQQQHQQQPHRAVPHLSKALGVDYGRRLIGLAVSTLGLAPRPLPPVPGGRAEDVPRLAQEVVERARTEGCHGIVVGLPVTQAGSLRQRDTDSQQGRRCRNFALNVAALAEGAGLHVFLVDETGTTAAAHEYLFSSGSRRAASQKMKDSVAAALILGKYFDDPSAAVFVRPGQWRQAATNKPRQPARSSPL